MRRQKRKECERDKQHLQSLLTIENFSVFLLKNKWLKNKKGEGGFFAFVFVITNLMAPLHDQCTPVSIKSVLLALEHPQWVKFHCCTGNLVQSFIKIRNLSLFLFFFPPERIKQIYNYLLHCSHCLNASFHFLWFKVKKVQFLWAFLTGLLIHIWLQLIHFFPTRGLRGTCRPSYDTSWAAQIDYFICLADVGRFFSCSIITFFESFLRLLNFYSYVYVYCKMK